MANVPNNPRFITIHHTQTRRDHIPNINRNHKKRGFRPYINRAGEKVYFGYHVYIDHSGFETYCRPISVAGQHCRGVNGVSIGICIEGDKEVINKAVLPVLLRIVKYYMKKYKIPASKVLGHGEIDTKKPSCPGFDMNWFRGLL